MLDEGLEALQEKIQGIKVEECSALTDQIKELQEKLDQTQSLLEEKLEAQIQEGFKFCFFHSLHYDFLNYNKKQINL